LSAPRRLIGLLPEIVLALAVVASCAWTARTFFETGYLPQPFIYDTNDTFMDWFNTAYWANHRGIYNVWRSIYPPLSFVFLDIFSLPGCYLQSPFYGRDCDWLGRGTIYASYLVNVIMLWVAFRRADRRTAPMRTVAFALGLPLLFTLERGNLILVTLPFFIVAYGNVTRSVPWRVISAAMTINFKPYLVVPAFAYALKRDWRMLELAGIASIAIYLLTIAWVGSGTPMELIDNTTNWIVYQGAQVYNEVNYATSYAPLLTFRTLQIPLLEFVDSDLIETVETMVPIVIRASQGIALLALVATWLQPRVLPTHRIAALMLGAFLVTQSPGGYTQAFLLFLVFLEPWRRPGQMLALTCTYVLCLVGDVHLTTVMEITANSWLSGRPVTPSFGIKLGHFIRPGLIVVILWALAFDTLVEVIRAHRRHRPSLGLVPA
jgi:hypothetical protein